MVEIKPEPVFPSLDSIFQKLKSENADLRRQAVYALEKYPGESIAPKVMVMLADPNRGVREAAGEIVVRLPAGLTGSKLVDLLGNNQIEIRNLAAKILTKIGSPVIPDLASKLSTGNGDVRKFIVDVLGVVGDPAAVQDLLSRLTIDPDDNVVVSTIEALGKIGAPDALVPLIRLYHERPDMQLGIIEAVGYINVPDAREFLESLVPGMTDRLMLMTLVDALGNTGDPRVIPTLTPLFGRFGEALDNKVVQALVTLGAKAGVNAMTECSEAYMNAILIELESENETLVSLIGDQVEAFPDTPCIATLLNHAHRLPVPLLERIITVTCENESLAPYLIPLIFHPDERISISALELIGLHIPAGDLVRPLSQLLLNPATDPDMLSAAIQAAGHRKIKPLAPVIEKLKNHREYDVVRLVNQASQYLNSLTEENGTRES
ncbi:MAG: HEAT repeat domain-containing protein [Candidatus Marinimicrobia bacterium]|nr:HEAT repeat domain-containing protein [Candidatus Neomarinimicrobiota bacterium]MCF7841061.1 HEAT repeat domain-containing protein [Candidatus Neomarinimicrobiota bacterium]